MSGLSNSTRDERTARQRAFWTARYTVDPDFFGSSESHFARWGMAILGVEPKGRRLVDLGCGSGRDLRYFRDQNFRVRGVDCAGDSPRRSSPDGAPLEIRCGEAIDFLRDTDPGSLAAVYSNLFYNMDFTEEEHRELFREAARVLAPGGIHLYAVRCVRDKWYGRGRQVGPDTFDSSPEGTTIHFFSEAYAEGLRGSTFELLRSEEFVKGKGEFPVDVLYFAERKR